MPTYNNICSIRKPSSTGTGFGLDVVLSKNNDKTNSNACVFLDLANQIPGQQKCDWDKNIKLKLGENEIGALIELFTLSEDTLFKYEKREKGQVQFDKDGHPIYDCKVSCVRDSSKIPNYEGEPYTVSAFFSEQYWNTNGKYYGYQFLVEKKFKNGSAITVKGSLSYAEARRIAIYLETALKALYNLSIEPMDQ